MKSYSFYYFLYLNIALFFYVWSNLDSSLETIVFAFSVDCHDFANAKSSS